MRTISIVNQKGGCGKTTTPVNLAGALAADGFETLVVDMDPQAHASLALGINPEELDETVERLALQLAAIDPAIAMKLRRCLDAANDLPLSVGLELERQLATTN